MKSLAASQLPPAPLSFAQQRIWFLEQLEPNGSVYNIPVGLRLVGALDTEALERSLNEIVRRHEVLRVGYPSVGGQPVQVVLTSLTLSIPVVDLTGLPPAEREIEARRLADDEAERPFDLTRAPLLRATVIRVAPEDHVLLLTVHHIVYDAWSTRVLYRELSALYLAFSNGRASPLPDLPIQYGDFAQWQRDSLQGEFLDQQLSYWKRQLEKIPTLQLPLDRPRPAIQTFRSASHSILLSKKLTESIKALSSRARATLFMTLLAAFKVLLCRYTGQEDIAVGTPIANRGRIELEALIGFFLNTLVLRTDLSRNPGFLELLARVRDVAFDAYAHQDLPFEKLVEELKPERILNQTPLFQVLFVLQNDAVRELKLEHLTVSRFTAEGNTTQFDFSLFMAETDHGLVARAQYNTDLFDAGTMQRLLAHYQNLLKGIVADPTEAIWALPLLESSERNQLLSAWNDTKTEFPKGICIQELFESQAERTPDGVAVVYEDQRLTYGEVNRRANQLARYLRTFGVRPEVLVCICMERSLEMIVGLLGILKAGGAYVPLDPAYPKERLAFMLDDCQATILLTQGSLIAGLPNHEARVVCLDTDWEEIGRESEENCVREAGCDNLAYVIYTSGSTGRPKGVAIEHRSAAALLHWARETFSPEEIAGTLASTSICFDLSIFEIFFPLSSGGKVIIAKNALELPTLQTAEPVTLVNTVPSAMAELMRTGGLPASVRTVCLAGEPLPVRLVEQIYQQQTIQKVFDLYGPTEDTTYSTFALRSVSGPATIGWPIANTQIYLLDSHMQPVPIGVSGELYIGGAGLARGYLNRPELTAEKFIPNPFGDEPGVRLYHTGDMARYLPDGNIEFLGRVDHQVKIRGFRIELGEIEAALTDYPGVLQSVAAVTIDESDNKRLAAYVVANHEVFPATSELRGFLKDKLPEYMIPSAFVILDALPLTPNGKVDRKALPVLDQNRPELKENFVSPRNATEQTIAEIWAQVLNVDRIGVNDNFFELGGHSLLATQVMSRLRDVFEVEIPLRGLFENPTVAELAVPIQALAKKATSEEIAGLLLDLESLSDEEADRLLAQENLKGV